MVETFQDGLLIVLSGPSGTGKGTICKALRKEVDIQYSISATTRKPRNGEEHGREYFFISHDEFQEKIDNNGLLEWARVYDNFYGTPRDFVDSVVKNGQDCILEIDPQGAFKVRQAMPEAVLVFIAPPSLEELQNRIVGRGTEDEAEIQKRMGSAESEILSMAHYDYVIVNDTVDNAVEKMKAVLIGEKCRVSRNKQL